MIVTIRVRPSQHGGGDEYVRLADMATMDEVFEELAATAGVGERYHRATAWSTGGKMLAAVGLSPDALAFDEREDVREGAAQGRRQGGGIGTLVVGLALGWRSPRAHPRGNAARCRSARPAGHYEWHRRGVLVALLLLCGMAILAILHGD